MKIFCSFSQHPHLKVQLQVNKKYFFISFIQIIHIKIKTISTTLIQKYFISVLDIANMEDVQSDQSEDDTLPNLPDTDNPDEAYYSDTLANNKHFYQ